MVIYRVDWWPEDSDVRTKYPTTLAQARVIARAESKRHDIAYIIARENGEDIGRILYSNGFATNIEGRMK